LSSGNNEVDTLIGGRGRDSFQLGDIASAYYTNNGNADRAIIRDFQSGDNLILHGNAINYHLSGVVDGARELRLGNQSGDLIATIRGKGISGLSLNDAQDVTFL
jgi:hypothetical protein